MNIHREFLTRADSPRTTARPFLSPTDQPAATK